MVRKTSAALTGGASSEGRVSGFVFKLIRESVGQTQEQFAERVGAGISTIQGWETGRRPLIAMSAGHFLALQTWLRCLGVDSSLLDALSQSLQADLLGFLELNIHTLWSLIRVQPEVIRDAPVAGELQVKLEQLLDQNLVSPAARRELDALRYGVAIVRRY